jgi:Spy/CpxP family protein refolding chaperone
MKKILSTALAIVLFVGASQAQTTEKKDHHRKGERKEQAFQNLNLTAEQKARMQSLREAQRKEMQELKKSGNVTQEQRKALHEKYRTQYQSILTPAQQEEMKKNRETMKDRAQKGKRGEKGKGFGKRGNMGQQAAFFKKELNLSADQETKLKGIFQEFQTKSKEVRSNNALSQEQKRTQFQSLAQQYMAQGKVVLTPEQAKKFEELKGKHMSKKDRNL